MVSGESAPRAVGTVTHAYFDCLDVERMATFWSALLGLQIADRSGAYVDLTPLPSGLTLGFQAVPEPKQAKNRLHLDLTVDDVETACARVLALGGRRLGDVDNWRVMADPEGNEFCLVSAV